MFKYFIFSTAKPIIQAVFYIVGAMALYAYFTGKDMNLVVGGLLDALVPVGQTLKAAFVDALSHLSKEGLG